MSGLSYWHIALGTFLMFLAITIVWMVATRRTSGRSTTPQAAVTPPAGAAATVTERGYNANAGAALAAVAALIVLFVLWDFFGGGPYTSPPAAPRVAGVYTPPPKPDPMAEMRRKCTGNAQNFPVTPEGVVINPDFCQVRPIVLESCVTWFTVDGRKLGRSCEGSGMPTVAGIHTAKADPGTKAVIRRKLCDPFASGDLLEVCA